MATKRYRKDDVEIDTIELSGSYYSSPIAQVPLMLNRGTKQFWAKYGDVKYADNDAELVRAQVTEAMRAANDVVWSAAIHVSSRGDLRTNMEAWNIVGDRGGEGRIHIRFSRFWWALFPDTKLRRVNWWSCKPEHRIGNAEVWTPGLPDAATTFMPPISVKDRDSPSLSYCLPYTAATWNGLSLLVKEIGRLNTLLETLVTTAEGRAALEAATLPFALPAPTDVTVDAEQTGRQQ